MTRRDYEAVAAAFKLLANDPQTNGMTLAAAIGSFVEYAEATYTNLDKDQFISTVMADLKARRAIANRR